MAGAGKRVDNGDRRVTTTAKSIKIIARNSNITNPIENDLGKRQLRNRCIILSNSLDNKFRKRRSCKSFGSISGSVPENTQSKGPRTNINISAQPTVIPVLIDSLSLRPSPIRSLENWKGLNTSSPISRRNTLRKSCSSISLFSSARGSEGFQDENLDYELDNEENEDTQNSNHHSVNQNNKISSDISTIRNESPVVTDDFNNVSPKRKKTLSNNLSKENFNNISKTYRNHNSTDMSMISHRSDMIPYLKHLDFATDARQKDYLLFSPSSSNRILLDSSSSSGSSSNYANDEMDEDENTTCLKEFDMTKEEEDKLLASDNDDELSPSEDVSSEEHNTMEEKFLREENISDENETNNESPIIHQIFQGSKITMKGKNITIKSVENRDCDMRYHPTQNDTLIKSVENRDCDIRYHPTQNDTLIKSVDNTNCDIDYHPTQNDTLIKRVENTNLENRRWNIRYHPYQNDTLFLKDIGYTPLPRLNRTSESSSEGSDKSSSNNSISMTSFKVTLGRNQERKCEEVHKPVQTQKEFGFKVPLPPIKRPPSRPKKSESSIPSTSRSPTSSVSDSSENYSRERFMFDANLREKKLISSSKEDDVISIAASSLAHEIFDQDLPDTLEDESWTIPNSENSDTNVAIDFKDIFNKSYVEDWLSSQQHNNSDSIQHVRQEEKSFGGHLINFKDVHPFFSGLCYHYYLSENCLNSKCRVAHVINAATFCNKFKKLTTTDMQNIYNFSLRFLAEVKYVPVRKKRYHVLVLVNVWLKNHTRTNLIPKHSAPETEEIMDEHSDNKLFSAMYPVLLKGFAFHKMDQSLISSIDDFFALKNIVDSTKAMERIIAAFEDTGLTFIEAVEKISFNVGFMRIPGLADILLDLLTQKPNVSENWEEIKRICRAKKYIAPNMLERIISKVLGVGSKNINKDLCRDIYKFIIKTELTDLSKVNAELLTPIKTFAQFGTNTISNSIDKNVSNERERFDLQEQTSNNGGNVDPDKRTNFSFRPITITTIDSPQRILSPAASSSKSSTSSGKFAIEQEILNDSVSPVRENFPYVPQVFKSPKKTDHIPPLMQNYHPPPLIINTSVPPPYPIIPKTRRSSIEVNLCPEIPIFGKFNFKKGFVFEESLHNLLPSSRDKVPINESDIVTLNDVINNGNGAGFLQLLDQYKCPTTLQHFITMCIAHLKNTAGRPYNLFIDLLENVENACPDFKTDPLLKGVFEVIVFNLLFFLERKGHWKDARKLIELFCDWDSLISSKLLQHFATQTLTPIGRYIFLARLLAEANSFYKVYDILQSPDLRLLSSPDCWPLFHATLIDVEQRNALLTTFFKYAYRHNVEVACDMYRNIFQFGNIWEFDSFIFFNPMLESMIDNERTSLLKHFYTYIDVFHKHMTKNVFRAFLIHLDAQLVLENKFKLYEMGTQKGLYVCFTGRETTILVRTNMLDVELKLILQYFMHKLALVPQEMFNNIRIEIKLPAEIAKSPKILQNCLRSIVQVNSSVKKLLYECFGIWKNFENDLNSTVVEISKEELKSVFS